MMPVLSIIIPIYNASAYIKRCVVSLMEQTIQNGIEYIFIDDGSMDSSIEIINEVIEDYPQRKEQVKILINSTNQGVYQTRKRGIQEANGRYIGWCDSDDWVERNYYESLLKATHNGATDIVVCDYTNIKNEEASVKHYEIQDTPSACIEMNYCKNSLPMELVIHLFKKEIINQAFAQIYPTCVGEDTYSIIHSYILARNICYVNTAGYYYDHRNNHSIMNTHGYSMQDWLPHQYNIEKISSVLYALPQGKNRFHKSVNSMKFWRKSGFRQAFNSEWEFYHTFRECYKDINVISHTPHTMKWLVYLLYNLYPLYYICKKYRLI